MKGIDMEAIIIAGIKGKRLRKIDWCPKTISVFEAMKEVEEELSGKYYLNGTLLYYDFHIQQREGVTVGMKDGEHYYYQVVTCERLVSWQTGYDDIIKTQTPIKFKD